MSTTYLESGEQKVKRAGTEPGKEAGSRACAGRGCCEGPSFRGVGWGCGVLSPVAPLLGETNKQVKIKSSHFGSLGIAPGGAQETLLKPGEARAPSLPLPASSAAASPLRGCGQGGDLPLPSAPHQGTCGGVSPGGGWGQLPALLDPSASSWERLNS